MPENETQRLINGVIQREFEIEFDDKTKTTLFAIDTREARQIAESQLVKRGKHFVRRVSLIE